MTAPRPDPAALRALLQKAKDHVMTDAERQAQRESWARSPKISVEEARRRLAELDQQIASATGWGAAMDEERRELRSLIAREEGR